MLRLSFLLLVLVLVIPSPAVSEAFDYAEAFNYLIGPRDVVEITIITSATSMSEDKTATYRFSVNSSGMLAIPLAGKNHGKGQNVGST